MWIYSNNPDQVFWLAENLKWAWHLNLFSRTRVKKYTPVSGFGVVTGSLRMLIKFWTLSTRLSSASSSWALSSKNLFNSTRGCFVKFSFQATTSRSSSLVKVNVLVIGISSSAGSVDTRSRKNSKVVENVDRLSELSLLNFTFILCRSRKNATLCFSNVLKNKILSY